MNGRQLLIFWIVTSHHVAQAGHRVAICFNHFVATDMSAATHHVATRGPDVAYHPVIAREGIAIKDGITAAPCKVGVVRI